MGISEIRAQYPQYEDLPDGVLLKGLHEKFYSDMPFSEFLAKSGVSAPAAVPSPPTSQSWGKTATDAVSNLIPSTVDLVKNVASAIASPVETVKGVIDVAAGGLQNALPKGVVDYINTKFPSKSAEEAQAKAAAVGKFYTDRYGSMEGFKKALGKDPAGVMADAATVLSGGAGVASKIPMLKTAGGAAARGIKSVGTSAANLASGLPKVGGFSSKYISPSIESAAGGLANVVSDPAASLLSASRGVDPLLQSFRGVTALARPVGSGVASVLGGIGTHTGGESIRQMAQAGFEGGKKYDVAKGQLRGTAPVTDLLDDAKSAFDNLRMRRSNEYVQSMQKMSGNTTVVPFTAVDQAVTNALNIKKFKGVSTSPTTAGIQDDILRVVEEWKNLDPTQYHTPSGLDALKQSIGDIRDATQFGTPSRKVADTVYNAVKNEIVKQDPKYAQAMSKYVEASETISEIQRHLLGGEKGSAVSSMRKLQNLMSTGGKNKSMEFGLLKELEDAGAGNLSAGLAGLSMQDFIPRMLSGRLGAGIGTAIVAANNPVVAAALLPLQSPRLVGEAALATGRGAGMLGRGIQAGRNATGSMFGDIPYDLYMAQADRINKASEEQQ